MPPIYYLGIKGLHKCDYENKEIELEIIRTPMRLSEMVHFSLENAEFPEGIKLQEMLKQADAVSCEWECKNDYILHLFKKKKGMGGWLERILFNIKSMKDFETAKDGPYNFFKEKEEIFGYEKIATISKSIDNQ
jgi:hypothetical protein